MRDYYCIIPIATTEWQGKGYGVGCIVPPCVLPENFQAIGKQLSVWFNDERITLTVNKAYKGGKKWDKKCGQNYVVQLSDPG